MKIITIIILMFTLVGCSSVSKEDSIYVKALKYTNKNRGIRCDIETGGNFCTGGFYVNGKLLPYECCKTMRCTNGKVIYGRG